MKRGEIIIPKGKILQVNVVGENVEDERLFTNSRKCIVYLNMIRERYPSKIKMKLRPLN